MKSATVFVNNQQVSIVTSLPELISEINHYQAFWLASVGATYSNNKNVKIVVDSMTEADRRWLSVRMR